MIQWIISYLYETTTDGADRNPADVASVKKIDLTNAIVVDRIWQGYNNYTVVTNSDNWEDAADAINVIYGSD